VGKSTLALVLDVCRWLGIREPSEFYLLAPETQALWLEHARNEWSGLYLPKPKKEK